MTMVREDQGNSRCPEQTPAGGTPLAPVKKRTPLLSVLWPLLAALVFLFMQLQPAAAIEFAPAPEIERPPPFSEIIPTKTEDMKPLQASDPCTLCLLLQDLGAEADRFAAMVINGGTAGPGLNSVMMQLWKLVAVSWFVVLGMRLIVSKPPQFGELMIRILTIIVITAFLLSEELWWEYVYRLFLDLTTGVAMWIVRVVGDSDIPRNLDVTGANPFAQLFGMVENTLFTVVVAGWKIFEGVSWYEAIHLFVVGLFVMLPYLFVIGIFAAFMVECQFKFLSITALAPVWAVSWFYQQTRSFTTAALRIYLSAGFTAIFAAMAMGFTVGALGQYLPEFYCISNVQLCGEYGLPNPGKDAPSSPIFSSAYWVAMLMGYISILLHLKAATLAANISGANDGAGPAAAVADGCGPRAPAGGVGRHTRAGLAE